MVKKIFTILRPKVFPDWPYDLPYTFRLVPLLLKMIPWKNQQSNYIVHPAALITPIVQSRLITQNLASV